MSFAMRTVGAHARWFTALATLSLSSCAPHHGGGGSGGEAGEGGSSGGSGGTTAGSAGTDAGGGGAAGSGGAATGGTGTAGSGGSSGSGSPSTEPIIGCPAPAWPEEGLYFVAPPYGSGSGTPAEVRLEFFSPTAFSANGRVVGGWTRDPESPNPRPVSAIFTLEDGATILPRLEGALSNEGNVRLLSCDGSVALAYDIFGSTLHRVEGDRTPRIMSSPTPGPLAMDPQGDIVLEGAYNSERPGPRVWTAETGDVYLPDLFGTELYHVNPDGTLIGSDFEALFKYDRATGVEEPIGMAPVNGASSIAFASSGNAWIQSADRHADSFLLWQLPAQPRSVTCPGRCVPVDLSSTGEVALLDGPVGASQLGASLVWTKLGGFVDLATLFTQHGLEVGSGRKLHALGMSDDARAFTGISFDPSVLGDRYFFYGVLPDAAYE